MAETTPRGPAPRNFEEAGYPPEAVEKLSQLHAVFDFYDTDRDGRIDRKTMRKMCDLIGFGNPTLPTTDDISFNVFSSCVMSMEASLGKGGEVRRAFHLMKKEHPQRMSHSEFGQFLRSQGLECSEDHAERITELISHTGEDYFTEDELVNYVLEAQANEEKKARNLAKRKKEEERQRAAEEAETMVGGLKDFVID